MTSYFHGVMKIEVCCPKTFGIQALSCSGPVSGSHMLPVRSREDLLVLFRSEKIDNMDGRVFLGQKSEMSVERWLRGLLRTGDLDLLAERLEALLLPENFESWCHSGAQH